MTTRIAVGSTVTLNHRFASAVPAGASVTVQATDALGEEVFAAPKAATDAAGTWSLELTAADLPDVPDRLTFAWDVNAGVVLEQDHVALDGAVYTSPARLKVRSDELLGSLDDAKLQAVIDEVLDRVESWIEIPFVSRYEIERFVPRYTRDSLLLKLPLRELRRVTVAGVALDTTDWLTEPSGKIIRSDGQFGADEAVEVHYVRGLDQPPADLVAAVEDTVEQLCLERYGRQQQPARAQFAGDGMSWIIANPDPSRGRLFGINRVDGVFKSYHDQWAAAVIG